MNSREIQEAIYQQCLSQDFTAPYGVLSGEHVSKKGTKYLSVTFGRARTLDATVMIYNSNFMILRTTYERVIFKSFDELMEKIKTL